MKREYKFRAFNHVANTMYYADNPEDVFKWQKEGQVQSITQYIGHYNNTDVYEGDRTWDGVIEFNPDTCCYVIRRINGTFIRLDVRKDKIEIKSNIYEMPF